MKINGIALYTLIATLNLVAISSAKAEDFNFTVPVQMNNLLPGVNSIKVSCYVLLKENGQSIGGGEVLVPVPDSGNLSTNVAVNFNAGDRVGGPDYDPSSATSYYCSFSVVGGSIIPPGYCDYSDPGIGGVHYTFAKAGTPFTRTVTGTIPQ